MSDRGVRLTDIEVGGVASQLATAGPKDGAPILYLHSERGIAQEMDFIAALGTKGQVFAPVHPGYSQDAPGYFSRPDDLAYFHLEAMDRLGLERCTIVAAGLGSWVALELLTKANKAANSAFLVAPVGLKFSGRYDTEMVDIFAHTAEEVEALAFENPALRRDNFGAMDEADLTAVARAREATARYAWLPYMHNPSLMHRLHRIKLPVTLIWGADDRINPSVNAASYNAALPLARTEMLSGLGHFPHIEAPETVAAKIDTTGSTNLHTETGAQ